jgi:hypothetical protein
MDILAKVDHACLRTLIVGEAGGCTPVTPDEMEQLLQATASHSALKRCAALVLPAMRVSLLRMEVAAAASGRALAANA